MKLLAAVETSEDGKKINFYLQSGLHSVVQTLFYKKEKKVCVVSLVDTVEVCSPSTIRFRVEFSVANISRWCVLDRTCIGRYIGIGPTVKKLLSAIGSIGLL